MNPLGSVPSAEHPGNPALPRVRWTSRTPTVHPDCDEACVDTAADDHHCGDCTTSCVAPEKCLQGKCGCQPRACATLECGTGEDGCGAALECGQCTPPAVWIARACLAPTSSAGT